MGFFDSIAAIFAGGGANSTGAFAPVNNVIDQQVVPTLSNMQSNTAVHVANAQNAALQREFAQQGIQWRVADARAAGLHGLAALGSQPASASPSFVPADSGQDISRAAGSGFSVLERLFSLRMQSAQVDNMELENMLLRRRIDASVAPGTGPGVPTNGPQPDFQAFRSRDGHVYYLPSEAASQAMQGEFLGPLKHETRKVLNPLMDKFQPVVDAFYDIFRNYRMQGRPRDSRGVALRR